MTISPASPHIASRMLQLSLVQKQFKHSLAYSFLNHGRIGVYEAVNKLSQASFLGGVLCQENDETSLICLSYEGRVTILIPSDGEPLQHFLIRAIQATFIEAIIIPKTKQYFGLQALHNDVALENHPCHHGLMNEMTASSLLTIKPDRTGLLFRRMRSRHLETHHLAIKSSTNEVIFIPITCNIRLEEILHERRVQLLPINQIQPKNLNFISSFRLHEIEHLFEKVPFLTKLDRDKLCKTTLSLAQYWFESINEFTGDEIHGAISGFECAKAPGNEKWKDRYPDIVPFVYNHCKLQDGGYYNASYISQGNLHFIAAQGPIFLSAAQETVTDFLELIVEQRSPLVIALGNCTENSRPKFADYFSDPQCALPLTGKKTVIKPKAQLFGIRSAHGDQELVVRHFVVQTEGEADWMFTHIHFMNWLDMKKPDSHLIHHLCQELVKVQEVSDKPPIIHCSAGAGRTGTLIAARILQEKIKKAHKYQEDLEKIDLPVSETVLELRQQRPFMVTSFDQFRFLLENAVEQLKLLP